MVYYRENGEFLEHKKEIYLPLKLCFGSGDFWLFSWVIQVVTEW